MNSITRRVTSLVVAGAILTGGAGAALAQCATPANANANGTSTQAAAQRGGNPAVHAAVAKAIQDTLGVTSAELKAAHKAGTSDAQLATQKGVARETLVNAVAAAITASRPATAPALTEAQILAKANQIVDNVPKPKRARGGNAAPAGNGAQGGASGGTSTTPSSPGSYNR
jgi:hypothetical protein